MTNIRNELTDDNTGRWQVTASRGSIYAFDLDTGTVERVGGDSRTIAAPSDSLQSLRAIIELRVGQRGRWWVRNASGGYVDPDQTWQSSSVVLSIEPAPPPPSEAGDRLRADVPDSEPAPELTGGELHLRPSEKRSRVDADHG